MYLVGLCMLWAFLLGLGFLLVAPFFIAAVIFFFGWVPAVTIGESFCRLRIRRLITHWLCILLQPVHC